MEGGSVARRTKEQVKADRAAREERLANPAVDGEQRLKDLQMQRIEVMRQLTVYKSQHQLEFFVPHARQNELVKALLDKIKTTFSFVGGNRCLHPDEPIFNPVTGKTIPVSKIPGSHYVLAWDDGLKRLVVAAAGKPFCKGVEPMFRVTLSNGKEFRASPAHRVLSTDGYVALSQLRPGCELFLPPSISDSGLSAHGGGDLRSAEKAPDFLVDCPPYSRSCGERLRREGVTARGSVPLQAGAQGHTYPTAHAGVVASKPGYSHPCPRADRLSIPGAPVHSEAPSALLGRSSPPPLSDESRALLCSQTYRVPQQFSIAEPSHANAGTGSDSASGSKQSSRAYCTSVIISSIEQDGEAEVWDFTVPRYHNYCHQSIIHHNSGKTEITIALAVCLAMGRLVWLPKPKPFVFPNPVSSGLLDNRVVVTHTTATLAKARETWDAMHPFDDPKPPLPGDWKPSADGETETGSFALPATTKARGEYDTLKARLSLPPDPAALRFKPPVKIRIFGEKTDTLAEVQNPKLQKFIAPEWLALTKKGQTGVIEHYLFQNGSTIDLLTYQQDPASMEGWDGHVCVFDEPPPRSVYIANVRGLVDHNGIALFSMTPLKEPWAADEIVNNPDPSFFSLTASSYDNPHVQRGALDAFFAKLDDDELETRRDGKFLHLQGLVFKEFDKNTHVIRPFKLTREYTVYAAIDNHPRTEQAVLFVAVDRHSRVFAFKEIFQHGTPEQVAGWVVDFHDHTHPIEQVLIDRSSQGDTNRGRSTYEIIEERLSAAGIPLDFGSKDLSSGIGIVRDYLRSQNGVASVFITEDCPTLIWEMQRYRWAEWRAGADKSTRTPMNKPVDAEDHEIENLRRLLQLPVRFVDPGQRANIDPSRNRWTPTDPYAGY